MHWAAHFLMPINATATMDQIAQRRVFHFFSFHGNNNNAAALRGDFISFRTKTNQFAPGADCWDHENDPLLFWQIQATLVPIIGQIAIRLFSTPANSVPSERSFSAQNLVHDKKRNRLEPDKVDKLTFIHMNQRALDNLYNGRILPHSLDNDAEIELENDIPLDANGGYQESLTNDGASSL